MQNRLQRLSRDERGISTIFVGVGVLAFMAATMLTVDIGMVATARSQAQNAADAGALAGAVALAFDNFTDRSPSSPTVLNSLAAAEGNTVMRAPVSITTGDVTFPVGPNGQSNRVRVAVFRTSERGNPVPTLIGSIFGIQTVNVSATATAEAAPANAMTCVKPFMIPDKWTENSDEKGNLDGPWTTGSTFDTVDKRGDPLPKPDVYVDANDVDNYTGYTVKNDVGLPLTLRAGTGDNINPSFYYSWKMPGDTGGDFYRENIANCNQSVMRFEDLIIQEPGDKTGPTIQGIEDLIAKDPNARWDLSCNCLKDSAYGGNSPRVFPIPLYNPKYYADGKSNGRVADFKIANFLGFFADHVDGNSIVGRITNVVGVVDTTAGPAPAALFPKAIRLVE